MSGLEQTASDTQIANGTKISFEVDYCRFVIADKKVAKRTAQEQTIHTPLRICNEVAVIRGRQRQRTVFAVPKLTIPNDKVLLVEIIERQGQSIKSSRLPTRSYGLRRPCKL